MPNLSTSCKRKTTYVEGKATEEETGLALASSAPASSAPASIHQPAAFGHQPTDRSGGAATHVDVGRAGIELVDVTLGGGTRCEEVALYEEARLETIKEDGDDEGVACHIREVRCHTVR
jgi:hypothetical protein